MLMFQRIILFLSLLITPAVLLADDAQGLYSPSKVVYDLSSPDPAVLENILDRVSMLQNIYNNDLFDASIIVVVHEGTIPLFKNDRQWKLMDRAKSLVLADIIKFKVCAASAKMQDISVNQLHNFVSMVPMADAELVKLQQMGYAYLR